MAPHPQLWNTRGVTRGSTSLAAGMSTSGSLTAWIRDLCGGVDFGTLAAEAAAVPPGSDGLLLLPYFAGERTEFELELRPAGTAFQRAVWDLLLGIPYGRTTSYGALALELGDPRKVRAVGLANGRNPISIVIPCHRVIGADGSLTGYGGGLERKRHLLDLEAEVVAGFRATLW